MVYQSKGLKVTAIEVDHGDLLIHQVAAVQPELLKDPLYQVILDHHTKPEEAGEDLMSFRIGREAVEQIQPIAKN